MANQIKPWWSCVIPNTFELDKPCKVDNCVNFNCVLVDSMLVFSVISDTSLDSSFVIAWEEKEA